MPIGLLLVPPLARGLSPNCLCPRPSAYELFARTLPLWRLVACCVCSPLAVECLLSTCSLSTGCAPLPSSGAQFAAYQPLSLGPRPTLGCTVRIVTSTALAHACRNAQRLKPLSLHLVSECVLFSLLQHCNTFSPLPIILTPSCQDLSNVSAMRKDTCHVCLAHSHG